MGHSRRKTYLVLLAVSALGLAIDRFVLTKSTTAPAKASAAPGVPARGARPVPTTDTAASTSIPEIPFPPGLKTADEHLPIPDLFAPPNLRQRGESGGGQPHNARTGSGAGGPSEPLPSAAFEKHHTLDGVLIQQRLRMAVLGGRPVRIGDTIDGCTLEDVSGYRARFECRDGPAVLIVKDTGTRIPG